MSEKNNHQTSIQFLNTVEQTITSFNMFTPGDSVLVGVSGGPDSVALLHALYLLASRFSIDLGLAHLDHGLRQKESEQDAGFVSNLASQYNLPFYLKKQDVAQYQKEYKLSLEDAARRIRYTFFLEIAEKKGYTRIATAHHANDNAELILMNLIRGTGTKGLEGIPPKRSNMIVRPLIHCYRSEILTFLSEQKLDYVLDSTNTDKRFTRNRIRLELIPQLKTFNPKISETLNRLGSIIKNQEIWIQDLVEHNIKDVIVGQTEHSVDISLAEFKTKPHALKQRIIRQTIQKVKGNLRRISHDHIEAIINQKNKGQIHLPDQILFIADKDILRFSKEDQHLRSLSVNQDKAEPVLFEYTVFKSNFRPMTLLIKEAGVRIRFSQIDGNAISDYSQGGQAVAFFDMKQITFPILIRNVKHGDRFVPFGMTGTQKVKNFFINDKVPKSERAKCPVFLSQGRIMWLAGLRMADPFKVTYITENILKAELLLA